MGTNYYLKKKSIYTPREDRDEGWYETYDFDFYENEYNKVLELTNGYVFNNTYYNNLEELNKNYYLTYHIGKSSAGWRFLLQAYPKKGLRYLFEWKDLFDNKDTKIFDEYGEEISKEEMLKEITHKEPNKDLLGKTEVLLSDGCRKYEVRDGLIVHPLGEGIIENSYEQTYDICDRDFC